MRSLVVASESALLRKLFDRRLGKPAGGNCCLEYQQWNRVGSEMILTGLAAWWKEQEAGGRIR